MTTLEYMEKQVQKHRINYNRGVLRGAPEEMLQNIKAKIERYEEAVAALREQDAPETLNSLADEIHKTAVEHGWWENPPSFGEVVALCHSELSEALEEYRAGRGFEWYIDEKPEGIALAVASNGTSTKSRRVSRSRWPTASSAFWIGQPLRALTWTALFARRWTTTRPGPTGTAERSCDL